MTYRLDRKDMQILYQLDLNSRQSDAEIGRKVGVSREVVKYRINNLVRNSIIQRFYTLVDVAKLGLISYKMYFQFQNLSKQKENEIIKFFMKHPNFEWLGSCSGRWDMIVGVWAKNIHKFNKIFMQFSNKYSKYIMSKAFTTTLGVPHYRMEYLIGKKITTTPMVYFGGEPERVELDDTDKEILKILANNARMPTIEIARKARTSTRIVSYRINELQKKKVIQAFRVSLNLSKLGYMFFKAFFYLQNITEEKLNKLLSYCASHPNIIHVILCAGPWDLEIEFEIESLERFDDSMKEIRERFGSIIRGTESVIISNDYGGVKYFPGCYGKLG